MVYAAGAGEGSPPPEPAPGGWKSLDGFRAALAGADADRLVDPADEYLAVADAAGMGGLQDGLDRAFQHVVLDHNLDLNFG